MSLCGCRKCHPIQNTQYELVAKFHDKFGLPHHFNSTIGFPDKELDGDDVLALYRAFHNLIAARDALRARKATACYRAGFLCEEVAEYLESVIRDDLPGIADALVDVNYVALGTAHFYGLPYDELFDEVQRANMDKVRGATGARGHALDVRKPEGWRPPDIEGILTRRRG